MKSAYRKRIFLDYASATPILPEVVDTMAQYTKNNFANASALYAEGVKASNDISESRKVVAGILRALPDEIVFTGSGTEADNLAIFGILGSVDIQSKKKKPHIIVSSFEHSAILEAAKIFEKNGGKVTYLTVSESGYIDPKDVLEALRPETVLVSIMYANNEIGTIQPIKDIAKVIRFYKKNNNSRQKFARKNSSSHTYPLFHTDASQAANYLSLDVLALGIDMMTLDSSKVYGPKGLGILFVKRGIKLSPRIVGGGQESGRRSGTENTPAIIGFAKALGVVQQDKEKESKRLIVLRDFVYRKLLEIAPDSHANGGGENRLPNTINICFPGQDAEFLVLKLDARGIAVSSSSSCQSKKEDSRSTVIAALGKKGCDGSSLRITLGRCTTKSDVNKLISCFPGILK